MVLIGIIIFQPMLLLVGGVVGTCERLVESKMLGRLRSGAVPWRDGLLLEGDGDDCYEHAEDGGGSNRLVKGEFAWPWIRC